MPIRISGMNSGLDTESIVSALVSGYQTKVDNYKKEQTELSWKQDRWKDTNKKIYSLYTSISNLRFSSAYSLKKATLSDSTKATVSAGASAVTGTHLLKVSKLAQTGYLTGGQLDKVKTTVKQDDGTESEEETTPKADTTLSALGFTADDAASFKITVGGKEETIDGLTKDSKISDVISKLQDKGVNASFDENLGRIFVSAKTSGKDSDFTISADSGSAGETLLSALKLSTGAGAIKQNGQDAEIELDGAKFTNTSNSFSINGLNINATSVTGDNTVSVTVGADTDAIYDKIKDFLTQYNEVVNELTSSYNADSAKGYEPLTDDEKSQMSDTEVEKWETKIKDSLLRNDSTLGGIIDVMTDSMSKVYTVNGKSFSWANLGVSTLGILKSEANEQNAYHIDGDEDDSATSSNTDKLREMITKDPDSVVDFLKQVTSDLYTNLDKKMKRTTLSSAYTVYNDKEMASEYSDYSDLISQWETRLNDLSESYYTKFSNMESALAKLQSNSSSLTGLFS